MGERTAAAAIDTLLAIDAPDDQLGTEAMGLIEAIDFDYERWCRVIGMDPDNEESERVFDVTRYRYLDLWTEMGEKEFGEMVTPIVEKWRRLLGGRD